MGVGPGTGVGGWTAGRQEGGEAAGPPSHILGQTLWPLSRAAPRGPQEVPRAFPLEGRNLMSPGLCCPALLSLRQLQMLRQAELKSPSGRFAAAWGSSRGHDHPGGCEESQVTPGHLRDESE